MATEWKEPQRPSRGFPLGWRRGGNGGAYGETGEGVRPARGASTGELVRDLVSEGQSLIREEFRLARAEVRQEVKQAGAAAGVTGVGGALVYAGVLSLVACVIAALALALPLWASALIVGSVVLLVGAMIAMGGIARLKTLKPGEETTQTLKEDREWMSGTMRDVRSRRRVPT